MAEERKADVDVIVKHVKSLLFDPKAPDLPPELADNADFGNIHSYLVELRKLLEDYAKGDFSRDIRLRGVVAGRLKALQANMLHLIWQMQQVESGDFSQRVDFMGDFSEAFNSMVVQLADALDALKQKEEELVRLTRELEFEVERRGTALNVLRKSEENFKYLAEHDPLTGLLNRRSFFSQAEVELVRNSIMEKYSCIALLDVDHFKMFNDTHGHPNGDLALKHIAAMGRANLRTGDIMARYGGEEFVFFFSKTTSGQGMQAAERIRHSIAETPVRLAYEEVPLTVSIGVTAIPPMHARKHDFSFLEFAIGLADSALYKAKSLGRNQVCMAEFQAAPFPHDAASEAHSESG